MKTEKLRTTLETDDSAPVWLRVGKLLTGDLSPPLLQAHLVYNADRILHVGAADHAPPATSLRPGQTQPDAELPECCALPGLIEAHAHFFLNGGELDLQLRKAHLAQSSETLLALASRRLRPLLQLGITAVRDAGDKDGVGLALSRQYKQPARAVMPYVDSPGAGIHRQGRYGGFMGEALETHSSIAVCVAARVKEGADRIKLIPTGIINFKQGAVTAKPQMSADELAAFVRAARLHHRQTLAHASGKDGVQIAIEGGVDSVEHGYFVTPDQLAMMRDRNIAWVPTFAPLQVQVDHATRMGWDDSVVGHLKRILDGHAASLCRAIELGVTVIAGSDAGSCGVAHGLGFLYELELMQGAGISAATVLNAATAASADRLAFGDKIGRIAAGYRTRIILTEHDPLATIRNLQKPKTTIVDGQVFDADTEIDSTEL